MGGSVKKAFSNPIRGLTAIGTFGTSELARKLGPVPKYVASLPEHVTNSLIGTHYGNTGTADIGGGGPFNLDVNQLNANQAAINEMGKKQYGDTMDFINQDQGDRVTARQKLADALTQQAASSFKFNLPGIEEDLNARHLLNGSGLGQEIGRQQGQIAADIANQVGVEGAKDIDLGSQQRAAALTGRQGFETGALQRGFSLEDFVNQANVAKTIGAQMAPQVGNGKGTAVAGLGAGAAAGAPFGPYGSAIGGGLGALLGSGRGK
jgi:hypothetical protein